MGMPQIWHRRQAMVLAGQLPENTEDAQLVLQAIHDLLERFLDQPAAQQTKVMAHNIVPFNAG